MYNKTEKDLTTTALEGSREHIVHEYIVNLLRDSSVLTKQHLFELRRTIPKTWAHKSKGCNKVLLAYLNKQVSAGVLIKVSEPKRKVVKEKVQQASAEEIIKMIANREDTFNVLKGVDLALYENVRALKRILTPTLFDAYCQELQEEALDVWTTCKQALSAVDNAKLDAEGFNKGAVKLVEVGEGVLRQNYAGYTGDILDLDNDAIESYNAWTKSLEATFEECK